MFAWVAQPNMCDISFPFFLTLCPFLLLSCLPLPLLPPSPSAGQTFLLLLLLSQATLLLRLRIRPWTPRRWSWRAAPRTTSLEVQIINYYYCVKTWEFVRLARLLGLPQRRRDPCQRSPSSPLGAVAAGAVGGGRGPREGLEVLKVRFVSF